MKHLRFLVAFLIFAASACATAPTVNGQSMQEAPEATLSVAALGALPKAQLPEKSCGMVLWTLDSQRPTPVFRYIVGKDAEIVVDQTLVHLTLMEFRGASGFGVFETQIFSSEQGLRVEVLSRFGLDFDGGTYLERGVIKATSADGWSVVLPAAGIAGCRS